MSHDPIEPHPDYREPTFSWPLGVLTVIALSTAIWWLAIDWAYRLVLCFT